MTMPKLPFQKAWNSSANGFFESLETNHEWMTLEDYCLERDLILDQGQLIREGKAMTVLVQRKWDKRRCSLRESEQNKHCEWIYRFRANPGPGVRAASCRPSGLGPGSALRSRPRVALSSAQALSV